MDKITIVSRYIEIPTRKQQEIISRIMKDLNDFMSLYPKFRRKDVAVIMTKDLFHKLGGMIPCRVAHDRIGHTQLPVDVAVPNFVESSPQAGQHVQTVVNGSVALPPGLYLDRAPGEVVKFCDHPVRLMDGAGLEWFITAIHGFVLEEDEA